MARYKVYEYPCGKEPITETDNLNRARKFAGNAARSKPGSVFEVRGAGGQRIGRLGPYTGKKHPSP